MVSKASELLPDPDSPVITISRLRGRSRSMFFRLWVRAPRMRIWSMRLWRPSQTACVGEHCSLAGRASAPQAAGSAPSTPGQFRVALAFSELAGSLQDLVDPRQWRAHFDRALGPLRLPGQLDL